MAREVENKSVSRFNQVGVGREWLSARLLIHPSLVIIKFTSVLVAGWRIK
jgi:hypothetical protein|tara:strand:- start:13 stop:162 length:150 start_codon:yes stop_codon:yes gene_type:complete